MLIDLLHLMRSLRRSPSSAAAAVITLSATLGAGTSIFAVVHAALLTPPPFKDPAALVSLGEAPTDDAVASPRPANYATFEAWRERAGTMATLEAFDGTNLTVTGLGPAERVSANDVTPGFLELLGVTPAFGRNFAPDEAGRPLVILSYAFWRGKLAGDPNVIGRQLVLGGQPHAIAGVLPERFVFDLSPADLWRPLPLTDPQALRVGYRVSVVARLRSTVSPAMLAAALDDVSRADSPPARALAIPISNAIAGAAARTLGLLGGAAALAILIAFVNFAGLLIVRSIDRQRELAIRAALGARGSAIAKQLLLEAQALVIIGTVGGIAFAAWATRPLARLALEQIGGLAYRDVAIGWQPIAVVALTASACAFICALLPALMAARRNVLDVLRRGATPPARELMARRAFVAAQVAIAFVLLGSVMLLGSSLLRLVRIHPGFDARGVMALQVSLPRATYPAERVPSFYSTLQTLLDERLGSRSTAFVNEIPLAGSLARSPVGLSPNDDRRDAIVREAGPAYFDVMRIPLVAGRSFEPRDDASAPLRVVVSESLAHMLFPFEQPLGRRFWLGAGGRMVEVIGVAGDVKHRALDDAFLPTVYLSALQSPSYSCVLVVRSARPPADVIAAVRDEVARLDASLPVYRVRSMEDIVSASPGMPARRLLTASFVGFAVLALLLSSIGIFGVVAHDVACRRAELAVRIALGADPRRIVGETLRQGAWMVGPGMAMGAVLWIWAARALGATGLATNQFDASSFSMPAAMLVAVGVAAVLPAALRAARTDPLITMRGE